jgi:hypothetical protein
MHASNSIIKFTDDTTVVGLITNNDETAYREEMRALGVWCQENNLSLNFNKTKKMIVTWALGKAAGGKLPTNRQGRGSLLCWLKHECLSIPLRRESPIIRRSMMWKPAEPTEARKPL